MKYGVKTAFADFSAEGSTTMFGEKLGGINELLSSLSTEFDVVELAGVWSDANPEMLKNAAELCHSHNLSVTIHGKIDDISNEEEFFKPYLLLFESKLQAVYNITVHPLESPTETERLLRNICNEIDKHSYPARITLENQRYRDESCKEMLCKNVTEIVKNINHNKLYTCFDFGHQMANKLKYDEAFDPVEDEFLRLARHTHIHSAYEGITHFPLSCGNIALEENIAGLLKHGYDEVLLLELVPRRYLGKFDVKESVFESLSILKAAVHKVKSKI